MPEPSVRTETAARSTGSGSAAARPRRADGHHRRLIWQAASVAVLLVVVDVVGRWRLLGETSVISVGEMLAGFWDVLSSPGTFDHVVATARRCAAALAMAVPLGVAIGFGMWRYPRIGRALEPYVVAAWSVPWFFFYPVLLSIFGLGDIPVVLISMQMMAVPIVTSTYSGLRDLPEIYGTLARFYRLSEVHAARKILIPAATPAVLAGVRVGVLWGFASLIAMEFLASTSGLGYFVKSRMEWYQPEPMYGGIILVLILSVGLTMFVGAIENRVRKELT